MTNFSDTRKENRTFKHYQLKGGRTGRESLLTKVPEEAVVFGACSEKTARPLNYNNYSQTH